MENAACAGTYRARVRAVIAFILARGSTGTFVKCSQSRGLKTTELKTALYFLRSSPASCTKTEQNRSKNVCRLSFTRKLCRLCHIPHSAFARHCGRSTERGSRFGPGIPKYTNLLETMTYHLRFLKSLARWCNWCLLRPSSKPRSEGLIWGSRS